MDEDKNPQDPMQDPSPMGGEPAAGGADTEGGDAPESEGGGVL